MSAMKRFMIKLYLQPGENTMQQVKQLPGLEKLDIDTDYGLILISPKRNLYTIRVSGDIDIDRLMSKQLKIKGIYPDIKGAPIEKKEKEE